MRLMPATALISRTVILVALSGCGANVVFGGEQGAGGAGGEGGGAAECVLGCGAECTKCEGDTCFTGWCSEQGTCTSPDVLVTCPE